MRVFFITFLLCITTGSVIAQQDYSAALIPKELLPYASSVVRNDETVVEIKDKDNVIYHVKQAITVLNKNGVDDAHIAIWYNKSRAVKNIKGLIYDEFGKPAGKFSGSNFQDQSYSDGFSVFDDDRYKDYSPSVTTYPYTIVYEYEVHSKESLNIDSWWPVPSEGVSIENSSYKIVCKPDYKINFKETNYPAGVSTSTDAVGNKVYSWKISNVKAQRIEPYGPNRSLYTTSVRVSPQDFSYEGITGSAANWQEMGKWIYDKLLTGRTSLRPETVAQIKELTKDAATPKEKAKIIYEYMQQKTRYVSIQIGIGGYQPFYASDVDQWNYGDCKALVNYTQALLKAADINSWYCVVKSGTKKSSLLGDFASMGQADHIILCVPFKNDTTWLECTSKNIPFGFLGDFTDDRAVLACTPEGGKLIHTPKYTAEENTENQKADFTLSENGSLDGKMATTFTGTQYELRDFMLNETYQDQVKTVKKNYPINNMDIETLKYDRVKKEKPVITETIKLKADEYASVENGRLVFLVNPTNRLGSGPREMRSRNMPVYINRGYTDENRITYTIPNGYKPDKVLLSINLHKNFGNYSANVSVNGNQLTYTRKIQLIDGTYSKDEYNNLVDFYQSVIDADHYTMTLVKEKN